MVAVCFVRSVRPVWNVGDVHCTCAVHKGFLKCTSWCTTSVFGLGAHRIFHYIGGSLYLPGAQPQPSVVVCCTLKSYIPYWVSGFAEVLCNLGCFGTSVYNVSSMFIGFVCYTSSRLSNVLAVNLFVAYALFAL